MGGFDRRGTRFQYAVQDQRQAGNGGFQTVDTQGGSGNIDIRTVFQRGQIIADGLFDGDKLGLVKTAQAAVDVFQYADRALEVA